MTEDTGACGISWDLSDLYAGVDDPRIMGDLEAALAAAQQFARQYRGTIDAPSGLVGPAVAAAVATLETILEQVGKACAYADLLHAADTTPPAHGALVAATQEKASAIRQE